MSDTLYSKAKETSRGFDGMELRGWPILSLVGGDIVMEDAIVYDRGHVPRFVKQKSNSALEGIQKNEN